MATSEVAIRIKATDQAGNVFRKVGSDAVRMGRDVEQAGQQSTRSMDRFKTSAVALGAVAGTVSGLLSDFARAAAEEEVVFQRLEQAVESAGDSFDVYSRAIDEAISRGEQLSFADDQVAEALGRLITVTGDTGAALDQMGLVMDLARARNIDLSTAADIVGKVMGGNIGILQRYGITVQEGATATEALALVQQRTAGQAETYASTAQGSADRIRNAFDNATETIGEHSGALQSLLTLLPGLSVGFSGTVALVGGLATALGPVGLAAAALAAGAAFLILRDNSDSSTKSIMNARQAAEDLATTWGILADAGDENALLQETLGKQVELLDLALQDEALTVRDLGHTLEGAEEKLIQLEEADKLLRSGVGATTEELDASERAIFLQTAKISALEEKLKDAANAAELSADAQLALTEILQNQGEGTDEAIAEVLRLAEAWDSGTDTNADFARGIIEVANNLDNYNRVAIETTQRTNRLAVADAARGATLDVLAGQIRNAALATDEFHDQLLGILDLNFAELLNLAGGLGARAGVLDIGASVSSTTGALEAAFRVIVQNTNAIGQAAQTTADWVGELVNVPGELGKIDELLANGQISQTTYNRAVDASNVILRENHLIQEDIQRIQANQIPILADLTAAQARQVDQLADMPPKQQAIALGWQDVATAQRAQELIALAAAAANEEVGSTARAAADSAIAGAVAADPFLKLILEDLGLITETDGVVTVNYDKAIEAQSATDKLTNSIGLLTLAIDLMDGDIDIDYSDMPAASEQARVLVGNINDVDATDATVQIYAQDNASGVIAAAGHALALLNGRTATTYIQTINLGTGSNIGVPGFQEATGGTILPERLNAYPPISRAAATGLTLVGEAGPELMSLPHGAQVTPHGASMSRLAAEGRRGRGGGVNIYGPIYLYPATTDVEQAFRTHFMAEGR